MTARSRSLGKLTTVSAAKYEMMTGALERIASPAWSFSEPDSQIAHEFAQIIAEMRSVAFKALTSSSEAAVPTNQEQSS